MIATFIVTKKLPKRCFSLCSAKTQAQVYTQKVMFIWLNAPIMTWCFWKYQFFQQTSGANFSATEQHSVGEVSIYNFRLMTGSL